MKFFSGLQKCIKLVCSFVIYRALLLMTLQRKPKKIDADMAVVCLASLGDFITFCSVAQNIFKHGKSMVLICREGTGIEDFSQLTGYFQRVYAISVKPWRRIRNLRDLSHIQVKEVIAAPAERHILSDLYALTISAEKRSLPDTLQACSLPTLKKIVDRKIDNLIPVTALYELERYEEYLGQITQLELPLLPFQFSREQTRPKKDMNNPYIVVFPGASGGTAKQWPVERFAFILNHLYEDMNCNVCICGTAAEQELGERLKMMLNAPAENCCGKTDLPTLKEILYHSLLVLANDSGGAHFSIACNAPTVIICGGWEYGRFYPNERMPKNCRAMVPALNIHSCMPCGKSRPDCVSHGAAPCVQSVEKEGVLEEIERLLKEFRI